MPLLLELYIFILGIALILSTLFVRLRDIGQVWELTAPADLLRVADHLSDRLPAAVPAGSSRSSTRSPRCSRTSVRSSSTRISPRTSSPSRTHSDLPSRALIPIAIAFGIFVDRALALQARGALVRGACLRWTAIRSGRVRRHTRAFGCPHQQRNDVQGVLPPPVRTDDVRAPGALDDVSFEIVQGEFFGIIGPNGSGKSTLLKILAGIYRQDSGEVQIDGLLSPFIELGVGFNPELTRARQRPHQRHAARPLARGSSQSVTTRSSPSRSSSASSTRS